MLINEGRFFRWLLMLSVAIAFLLPEDVSLAVDPAGTGRERITTEGEGQADIVKQDLSHARQEAMEDALASAFEVALLESVPAAVSLAEHRRILQELLPMKKRFLLKYRILSEMPAMDVFFVTVEATFSNSLIQEDLVRLGIVVTGDEIEEEVVAISVRVRGVSSFRWYHDFLNRLRNISPRIKSARPYEIYKTEMIINVEFNGDAGELENLLLAERFDDFQIRVDHTGEEEISVSLVSYEDFS